MPVNGSVVAIGERKEVFDARAILASVARADGQTDAVSPRQPFVGMRHCTKKTFKTPDRQSTVDNLLTAGLRWYVAYVMRYILRFIL